MLDRPDRFETLRQSFTAALISLGNFRSIGTRFYS
jgi:hypothetical protein